MSNNINRNNRWVPIIIAVSVVVGIVIGTFFANRFAGNRLNIINTSSNKLNDLLHIIDDQYVDTVDIASIVEQSMPKILEELDPHSTYISAKDAKTANDDLKGKSDNQINKHLLDTYSQITTISKELDATGLDNVLKMQNGRIAIVDEGVKEWWNKATSYAKTAWDKTAGFRSAISKYAKAIAGWIGKWADKLLSIFKSEKGKECNTDKIKSIWDKDAFKAKANMTDEEKKKLGVTWSKDVSAGDVSIMEKSKFYKHLCLISLQYGPKSLEYIIDTVKKVHEQYNTDKSINAMTDDEPKDKKDDKKETNESYRFSRFGRMRSLNRRFR